MRERIGGCLCGAVRYAARGDPDRIGMCHCLDCRKACGAFYAPYAVWPIGAVTFTGKLKVYANRGFCPECGSRVAWLTDDEAEIYLGSLDDAPGDLVPTYELWTGRRETWMKPLPWADQYSGDREDGAGEPQQPIAKGEGTPSP